MRTGMTAAEGMERFLLMRRQLKAAGRTPPRSLPAGALFGVDRVRGSVFARRERRLLPFFLLRLLPLAALLHLLLARSLRHRCLPLAARCHIGLSFRSRSRPVLAVPVDDSAASEVVLRELDAHPVARQHPDAVPPHLPGGVRQRVEAVLELHAEHAARERLHHFAVELALLLFCDHRLL